MSALAHRGVDSNLLLVLGTDLTGAYHNPHFYMEKKNLSIDVAGRTMTVETGVLANQSHGAVTVTYGETVVFASAMMGEVREGTDFFPLTVDYEENFYAAGKIKGSRFVKREGRPSENAVLNSRLIDRPIRPLFPKGMVNDVQLICTVLSADMAADPAVTALNAASAAICRRMRHRVSTRCIRSCRLSRLAAGHMHAGASKKP